MVCSLKCLLSKELVKILLSIIEMDLFFFFWANAWSPSGLKVYKMGLITLKLCFNLLKIWDHEGQGSKLFSDHSQSPWGLAVCTLCVLQSVDYKGLISTSLMGIEIIPLLCLCVSAGGHVCSWHSSLVSTPVICCLGPYISSQSSRFEGFIRSWWSY